MKNRALIALITIVAAIFGGLALTNLKQELAPSITFPQLAVLTTYPGAAPEVVNQDISTPVETAIQGVPGIESTTATSSTNVSLISVSFTYGTDLILSEQKINQAINRIKSTLPTGVEPQVITGSFADFPVLQVAVTSDLPSLQMADLLRASTLGQLKDVAGVRDAALVGAPKQRVTITPNQAELRAQGLSTKSIKDALDSNGVLIPAGSITENDQTLSVQAGDRLVSLDSVKALPLVGGTSGVVVTIADVATVELGNDPTSSLSRVDGKPAVTIAITKLPAANTVDVSKAVNAILPGIEQSLGSNAKLTVVFDQAPYIQKSIESLTTEGLLGLLFAVIVILLFLMSVRSTLVTAISIPTSVLITFIGLQVSGYTLNILTLGALTIAIGRVVDDSIVVIENIKRRLVPGVDRASTIVDAVRQVAGAVTASTATTVAVFLPISFVGGVTGELFRPFALTVTIALVASLFVSLTIVPVLAYWFLRAPSEIGRRAEKAKAAEAAGEESAGWLQRGYLPIIRWTLKHAVVTILLAVLVLAGTIAMTPFMKTNFLGSSGQNTFTVTQAIASGTSLAAQDTFATTVEQSLMDTPGVTTVQLSIGSSGSALRDAFVGGGDGSITYSVTTDDKANQTEIQDAVRTRLASVTDIKTITIGSQSGFGAGSDIKIEIQAPDQESLATASAAVVTSMQGLSSVDQVTSDLTASRPFISVIVNRDKAAQAGYSEVALGGLVSQVMRPTDSGSVVISGTAVRIYISTENPPATQAALAALQIPTPAGFVALDTLATVAVTDGPAAITTIKGARSATVTVSPKSSDLGTASAQVQKAVDAITLPAGATAKLGGATSDQQAAFSQLGIALLIAILVVYIIMVATFGSLLQPLLLLVSVPFAATGAIALQVATGIPLGVPSIVGVLMLIGIVVTNAIVLIDLVNQYRAKGMDVAGALIEGAKRRLRPILMTALATIFALVPMAMGLTGSGGFISQPLAIVVIGGLLSSTVLTLIVLPVLYFLVEGKREKNAIKRDAKRADKRLAKIQGTVIDPS
ncbi:efflux RND transporter permease subunit [Alpinimonas psychrophila]|uniref:HAE1 family hydrophobic/amphiphilic exporter-1 n=2 Tax=Alpinimonas psychrophila TaxID=748908 RepID=A0A7W3JUW4_9MICO|nr:efflux RND transporter permease subunit [Alpinimonas psychrophila]MBA8829686.1 HAE1 family hydrophobic/amphiphilic exporter-1 [Alpinimonas psychrophila]